MKSLLFILLFSIGCSSTSKRSDDKILIPRDFTCFLMNGDSILLTLKGIYTSKEEAIKDSEEISRRLTEKKIVILNRVLCIER